MTPGEARQLLLAHAGLDMDTNPAKWESGFVSVHRSVHDDANEGTFLEIMECILILAPEIAAAPTVDRELMAALWELIFLPRVWAFNPNQLEGVIRSGRGKLDGNQLSRLADQLDRIAEAVDGALNGIAEPVDDAMIGYGEPLPSYVEAVGKHA